MSIVGIGYSMFVHLTFSAAIFLLSASVAYFSAAYFLSWYLPTRFPTFSCSWTWDKFIYLQDIGYCHANGVRFAIASLLPFGKLNRDSSGNRSAGICGLGVYGLQITVPKSFFQEHNPIGGTGHAQSPTVTEQPITTTFEYDDEEPRTSCLRGRRRGAWQARWNIYRRRLRWLFFRRLLHLVNWCGRKLSFVVGWLSLEIQDISIHVENLGTVTIAKVRVGMALKRDKDNYANGWLRLEGVRVVENVVNVSTTCFDLPRWTKLEFIAPLDQTVGLGGLLTNGGLKPSSVNVRLSLGNQNAEVQVDKIKKAVERFKELMNNTDHENQEQSPQSHPQQSRRRSGTSSVSMDSSFDEASIHMTPHNELQSKPLPSKHIRNFLRAICEVRVSVPKLRVFISHYPSSDPLPESAWPIERPRPQLPRSIGFLVQGDDLELNFTRGPKIKGVTQGEWFGGEDIITKVNAGIRSLEVRLRLDDGPESESLHLGTSSLNLSTNWFPENLQRLFSPTEISLQQPLFPGDANSHLVIAELEIGTMTGKCSMSELEAVNWGLAVRSYRYRSRKLDHGDGSQATQSNVNRSSADRELVAGLPRLIGCVKLEKFSYMIAGRDDWRREKINFHLNESTINVQTSYQDKLSGGKEQFVQDSLAAREGRKFWRRGQVKQFSTVDLYNGQYHTLIYQVEAAVTIGLISMNMDVVPSISSSHVHRSYFTSKQGRSIQEILTFGPLEYRVLQIVKGWQEYDPIAQHDIPILDLDAVYGDTKCLADVVTIDFWHPSAIRAYRDTLGLLSTRPSFVGHESKAILDRLIKDQYFHLSLAQATARIAKEDPREGEKKVRGIKMDTRNILLEYLFPNNAVTGMQSDHLRQQLNLREDIRSSANSYRTSMRTSSIPKAFFELSIEEANIEPVPDARDSQGSLRDDALKDLSRRSAHSQEWELIARDTLENDEPFSWRQESSKNGRRTQKLRSSLMYFMNLQIPFSLSRQSEEPESAVIFQSSAEFNCLISKITLSSLYYLMVASTVFQYPTITKERPTSSQGRIGVLAMMKCQQADIVIKLDESKLYAHMSNLDFTFKQPAHPRSLNEVDLKCTTILLAGLSRIYEGKFDELLRIKDLTLKMQQKQMLRLEASVARLRIPFKFVLADIIEASVNMAKCLKQLAQRVLEDQPNWVIVPSPTGRVQLFRCEVNIPTILIELEDDPFENKLNTIWMAGLEEQKARSNREQRRNDAIFTLKSNFPQDSKYLDNEEWKKHFQQCAQEKDALSWQKSIAAALESQQMKEQHCAWKLTTRLGKPALLNTLVPILPPSRSTPLARLTINGVRIHISQPHFDDNETGLHGFLFDVGKGVPSDTQFNLLVPAHLEWTAKSVKCTLRDFPLPLLEILPPAGSSIPAWEFATDLVIAEEHGPSSSVRWATVTVVDGSACTDGIDHIMQVPRTAMPTKTYMTPIINVNTTEVTRIGWGNSMHPTIQDVIRVLDSLTKPSPDPSERIAFWDKIRLVVHWRVELRFVGPVYLHLKGSRDPYNLQGFGAGFVMAWMDDTVIRLGHRESLEEHHEFLEVKSNRFVLAVPDLRGYAVASASPASPKDEDMHPSFLDVDDKDQTDRDFALVCVRLTDGVRWGMGIVPERTCTQKSCQSPITCSGSRFHRQCRFFTFKPHYKVVTSAISLPPGVDSFEGFRSDFVHFSISLASPVTMLQESTPNESTKRQFNAIHLTPEGMSHFFAWWRLFDGTLSLPVRQGKVFPAAPPPSAKFGKHCGTIKYSFRLAPIFVSHTVRHEEDSDWARDRTTILGLKGRMKNLRVDLHQRMQEESIFRPQFRATIPTLHKPFYYAEVNCKEIDLRLLSASFNEKGKSFAVDQQLVFSESEETSRETDIEAHDPTWWEQEDYHALGFDILDRSKLCRLSILKILSAPRFTFYKHLPDQDDEDEKSAEPKAVSKFGDEATHSCLVDENYSLFLEACDHDQEMADEFRAVSKSLEDDLASSVLDHATQSVKRAERDKVREMLLEWQRKIFRNENLKKRLEDIKTVDAGLIPVQFAPILFYDVSGSPLLDSYDQNDEKSLWHNQYYFDEPRVFIDNRSRDVLLQYLFILGDMKASSYHTSPSVLKDLEGLKPTNLHPNNRAGLGRHRSRIASRSKSIISASDLQAIFKKLAVNNGNTGWAWDSDQMGVKSFHEIIRHDPESDAAADLSENMGLVRSHFFRLKNPQVILDSNRDRNSRIILTISRMEGRIFSVLDAASQEDTVHSLVLHRSYATLDSLQVFYPTKISGDTWDNGFIQPTFIHTFQDKASDQSKYGCGPSRIVPVTSLGVRFDKFNQLRISKGLDNRFMRAANDHLFRGVDRFLVDADRLSVRSTPVDFQALYDVISDLILFSDPKRKQQLNQLQTDAFKISLNDDLSDLVKLVKLEQDEVRRLSEQFSTQQRSITTSEPAFFFSLQHELLVAKRGLDQRIRVINLAASLEGLSVDREKAPTGLQLDARAPEIEWSMNDQEERLIAKVVIKGAHFAWTNKQQSVTNTLVIKDLKALDGRPDASWAEIITKTENAVHPTSPLKGDIFAYFSWESLPPVGGIPVFKHFEVHLHPVRLQIEHQVGEHIWDYILKPKDTSGTIPAKKKSGGIFKQFRHNLHLPSMNANLGNTVAQDSNKTDTSSIYSYSSDVGHGRWSKSRLSFDTPQGDPTDEMDPTEMRSRSTQYKSFASVSIAPTTITLSYKPPKKSTGYSLPELRDITYRSPQMEFRHEVCTFGELFDQIKSESRGAAWDQKFTLMGQVTRSLVSKAPTVLPLQPKKAGRFLGLGKPVTERRGYETSDSIGMLRSQHLTDEEKTKMLLGR